jgi:hypothetical protein
MVHCLAGTTSLIAVPMECHPKWASEMPAIFVDIFHLPQCCQRSKHKLIDPSTAPETLKLKTFCI